jgi:hypothetical protein
VSEQGDYKATLEHSMSCFLLSELVELCHTSWVAPGVPVRETVGGSPVSTVDALRLPMQAFTVAEAEVMPKTRKAELVQVPLGYFG